MGRFLGDGRNAHARMDEALTAAELREFRKHVDGLNRLIAKIRKRYPEAQYYLACSIGATLNILSGDAHEGPAAEARQDRIIEALDLDHADAGDW